jgi:3-oxoacyl-[acyl-carrier-protein] synthase-1
MSTRVFITGTGIISSIGKNLEETLNSILSSKSGIGTVKYLNTAHTELPVAEVKLSDHELFELGNIPLNEVLTRSSLLGIIAAAEAIKTSGIRVKDIPTAFISATTVGGMDVSEHYYFDFLENNSRNKFITTYDCAESTERIAEYFGLDEYLSTVSTACSSSANSIILGARMIKNGLVDRAICGGTECMTKFHLNGFNALAVIDKNPCKPFDQNRNGITLGEAAAFLVLESEKTAFQPGKKIFAELTGYSNICEAFHPTATSDQGDGPYLAMKMALKMAGLDVSDIDYINAHGTGTVNNDSSEGFAIERLFGKHIPPFSSTKSFTGHTTSAAGAVEAVLCLIAMQNNLILPNLNYSSPMSEIGIRPVAEMIKGQNIKHVLSNSFGFGGNESCLVLSKI